MNNQGCASIRFALNGRRYELAREDVETRLAGVAPDAIRKHAVRVSIAAAPAAGEAGTR